jgi:hypothetical protein
MGAVAGRHDRCCSLHSLHPMRAHASRYRANLNISVRDAASACVLIRTVSLQLFPSLSHTYALHVGNGPVVHSTQMTFPKTGALPQVAPGRSVFVSCGRIPVAHRDDHSAGPACCKPVMPTGVVDRSFRNKSRHVLHFSNLTGLSRLPDLPARQGPHRLPSMTSFRVLRAKYL